MDMTHGGSYRIGDSGKVERDPASTRIETQAGEDIRPVAGKQDEPAAPAVDTDTTAVAGADAQDGEAARVPMSRRAK
ncbi:MAG: hypothetical protein KA265_20160 [Piscinibacter sp.]|nr:hypothetical protein [Piscinibacter sp.]